MKFTKLIPLVLCTALFFGSCDDDDEYTFDIPTVVENNFLQQYPNASAIHWEQENEDSVSYLKAEFTNKGIKTEAWYKFDGTWVKTETDYNEPLPLAITNMIATNFPTFRIDDVEWVETPLQNFFDIELEKDKHDINIFVLPDGTIIAYEDNLNEVPSLVLQNFYEHYPEATVQEWEKDKGMLKVEFVYQKNEAEAWFTYNGEWKKTATEFHSSLPGPVSDYIQSNYSDFKIDEVKWIETPEGNYFEIELEKANKEILLSIFADGNVLSAVPDNN